MVVSVLEKLWPHMQLLLLLAVTRLGCCLRTFFIMLLISLLRHQTQVQLSVLLFQGKVKCMSILLIHWEIVSQLPFDVLSSTQNQLQSHINSKLFNSLQENASITEKALLNTISSIDSKSTSVSHQLKAV